MIPSIHEAQAARSCRLDRPRAGMLWPWARTGPPPPPPREVRLFEQVGVAKLNYPACARDIENASLSCLQSAA
eukprot:3586961-Pleurochrysis_carterae.AAC.2